MAETTSTSDAGTRGVLRRNLLGTQLPGWLLLGLIALGVPRTVLADLGVVAPESSPTYYVLALGPFAGWLAVAVFRRSGSPLKDHLVAGTLYGLSLAVVHEVLWTSGASLGQHPTQGAVALAERFDPPVRDLVLHGCSFVVAMTIGLGVGLTAGVAAAIANRVRTASTRR
jgi:hypothetical protein